MRIGFFTDTYRPQVNGVVTTVDNWKKELERRGHEVVVVCPSSPGTLSSGTAVYALPSVKLPYYKGYSIGLAGPGVPDELANVDIVHTHTPMTVGAYGAYIASKFKIPRIATYHTPVEEYVVYMPRPLRRAAVKAYQLWERKYLKTADTLTAPTKDAARFLHTKTKRKVTVLSNGVDVERFRKTDATKFRKRYNLGGCLVGFAGRHSAEKRLEDLIRAADQLDATVVITGDGPYRKTYEKLARGRVRFLGFLSDEEMPAFYSTLDVLVMPSVAETQGLVVLEANACGTPAVGARAAALKDTIKDGVNGYLYEPGNITDLVIKINLALKNKAKLSKGAVNEARRNSVQKSIDVLEKIYKNASPRGGPIYKYIYKVPVSICRVIYSGTNSKNYSHRRRI